MQFGVKTTEEQDISSGSQSNYIKYFAANGSYTLRFLEPWDEWISYWEHYSEEFRCSYPCTANTRPERKDCPGCQLEEKYPDEPSKVKEAKVGKKYLVNAIRTDDPERDGYVDLYKIPGGLKEPLEVSWHKDGSMWRREYNVIRYTRGDRVAYTLDKEDPTPFDQKMYADKLHDKQAALLEAWEYRWDDAKRAEANQARESRKAKVEEERVNGFNKPAEQQADPPFEPAQADDDTDQVLGESEIRAMTTDQLKVWFRRAGVPIPDTDDAAQLAETLISALE